jgi:hypothetical protein
MNKPNLHKRLVQRVLIFSLGMLLLSACNQSRSIDEQVGLNNKSISTKPKLPIIQQGRQIVKQDISNHKVEAGYMQLNGQVIYQEMEGGFYSFIANDGRKFSPIGLEDTYKRHGLVVQISAQEMNDVMTIMQFGTVIKILDVKVLDESKVSEIKTKM